MSQDPRTVFVGIRARASLLLLDSEREGLRGRGRSRWKGGGKSKVDKVLSGKKKNGQDGWQQQTHSVELNRKDFLQNTVHSCPR